MNVKSDNTPPAENVHEVAVLIILAEVGLEIPYGGEEQEEIVLASAGANPLPETVTTVPTAPDVGLNAIVGEVLITVNVA